MSLRLVRTPRKWYVVGFGLELQIGLVSRTAALFRHRPRWHRIWSWSCPGRGLWA